MHGGAERAGIAEQFRHLAEQVPGLRHLGALVEVIELPGRQLRRGPELDDLLEAGHLAGWFELDGNGQAQQEVCQRAQDERRDLHGASRPFPHTIGSAGPTGGTSQDKIPRIRTRFSSLQHAAARSTGMLTSKSSGFGPGTSQIVNDVSPRSVQVRAVVRRGEEPDVLL